MIDVLRNHTTYIPENYMLKSWILELFWHKNYGIAGCTCYKSLVSSAQKTRKKGKKVVKTNNGGNLCSLFPLIQIKKANNFLPMHDCCTINNFRTWWFRVCNIEKLPAATISILHFIGKVSANCHYDSFKGQEISKVILLETPLPQKATKICWKISTLASKMKALY